MAEDHAHVWQVTAFTWQLMKSASWRKVKKRPVSAVNTVALRVELRSARSVYFSLIISKCAI